MSGQSAERRVYWISLHAATGRLHGGGVFEAPCAADYANAYADGPYISAVCAGSIERARELATRHRESLRASPA